MNIQKRQHCRSHSFTLAVASGNSTAHWESAFEPVYKELGLNGRIHNPTRPTYPYRRRAHRRAMSYPHGSLIGPQRNGAMRSHRNISVALMLITPEAARFAM